MLHAAQFDFISCLYFVVQILCFCEIISSSYRGRMALARWSSSRQALFSFSLLQLSSSSSSRRSPFSSTPSTCSSSSQSVVEDPPCWATRRALRRRWPHPWTCRCFWHSEVRVTHRLWCRQVPSLLLAFLFFCFSAFFQHLFYFIFLLLPPKVLFCLCIFLLILLFFLRYRDFLSVFSLLLGLSYCVHVYSGFLLFSFET